MSCQTYHIPYSKTTIGFSLPESMQATLIASQPAQPIQDASAAIDHALADPIGSPPLRDLADASKRVCIAFTDITRACPEHLLVPAILRELELADVGDENITLLCATGMHRSSTAEERINKLGKHVVDRYHIIDNEPQNPAALVNLGKTSDGAALVVHRAAVEADLLISTGVVEPHQYAGYSGGSKCVAVGAAGEALIAHTHGPAFVDHPDTRLGRIEGNPFQEIIREAAKRAGLNFILNVVLDENQRILCVKAGDPNLAFRELVAFARSVFEVPIPHQFDIVIAGVGYPKDSNLYQASRAPSYLFFAPTAVIKPGGFFIIPARCEEGAGTGVGEQRFLTAMRDAPNIQFILDDARHNGYPPGQQRAFVLAKVLEQNRVAIVGSECPEIVKACKMIPASTMEEAINLAQNELGKSCETLIVPHALQTLPVITPA